LDLDENLVLVQVGEDETLHQHDSNIIYLRDEGDGNEMMETEVYKDYDFILQDYLF